MSDEFWTYITTICIFILGAIVGAISIAVALDCPKPAPVPEPQWSAHDVKVPGPRIEYPPKIPGLVTERDQEHFRTMRMLVTQAAANGTPCHITGGLPDCEDSYAIFSDAEEAKAFYGGAKQTIIEREGPTL